MKKIIAFVALAMPSAALAQALSPVNNVNQLSTRILGIFNIVIYLLVALAVLFIVYNVVMYLVRGGNPEEKSKAGGNILWGIVGLVVIVSIWGIVGLITNSFSTTPTTNPIPNIGNNTGTGGIPGNQVPQVQ